MALTWIIVSYTMKYISKAKQEPKIIAWCAVSEVEVLDAFIDHVKAEAVKTDVHIKKYLPKIKKCIHKCHVNMMSSSDQT